MWSKWTNSEYKCFCFVPRCRAVCPVPSTWVSRHLEKSLSPQIVIFLAFEDILGMSLAFMALCFCVITSVVFWVFVKHRDTPISSVQLLSHIRLFVTPWTTACQASLSITNSQNLLKLISTELVMPSSYLVLCHPFLLLPSIFPSIGSFLKSWLFTSGGQSIGASVSVLPMNIQDWFPLELSG